MAAILSLCFSLDPQHHLHQHHHHHHLCFNTHFKSRQTLPSINSPPIPKHPLPLFHKSNRYTFKSSSFPSSSSSSPSTTATTTTETAPPSSFLEEPRRTGRFLSNEEYDKLKFLEDFRYFQELESGSLWIRAMRADEMDITAGLLAESFLESMLLPPAYVSLLRFLVKQYLVERRALMPHAVTLIGFYRRRKKEGENEEEEEEEEEEERLAGTVEVCFDKKGANASATPTPPKNSPYICNMTVKEQLRRRGIGWHLLKASEELISQISSSVEVYLHCRMIDTAPFNMYIKAGYYVVKTDSILILLMLQRRKHLMCKRLPVLSSPEDSDMSGSEDE